MQQINWPIEGLSIIAPIIFIVLVVIFPLIGLVAGWKKAAFWGGGNLLFFLIGLLIWRFAGVAIIRPIKDLLTNLLQSIPGAGSLTITDQLLVSVASPVWFIVWMFISEIILLINYFAWYKRVVGLKKIKVIDKKTGKVTKQYAKINTKAGTTSYKVLNRVGGVLLLGALTLPTTITFTQTIYYLTTSSATRSKKDLSNNIYSGLQKLNDGPFNWMTYYPQTGTDFNALFSALDLISKEITYFDPVTGEEKSTSMMEYTEQVIGAGVSDLMDQLGGYAEDPSGETTPDQLTASINNVSDAWNTLVNQCEDELVAIFSSDNVGDALNQIIGPIITQTQGSEGSPTGQFEITEDMYKTLFLGDTEKDPLFKTIADTYLSGGTIDGATTPLKPLEQIEVPQSTVDNMTNLFYGMFNTSEIEGIEGYEETIKTSLGDIISIMFAVPQ